MMRCIVLWALRSDSVSRGQGLPDGRFAGAEVHRAARHQQQAACVTPAFDFDPVFSEGQFALELLVLSKAENGAVITFDPPLLDLKGAGATDPPGGELHFGLVPGRGPRSPGSFQGEGVSDGGRRSGRSFHSGWV